MYQSGSEAYTLTVSQHDTFYGEELLATRPTPELEDCPLSAVRDCLFNILVATLHIGGRSSIRNPRTRHAVVIGPEGKRPLGRPRRRWEDNIKMDLQEEGCGGMDWIELAEDRDRWQTLVTAVMNFRIP